MATCSPRSLAAAMPTLVLIAGCVVSVLVVRPGQAQTSPAQNSQAQDPATLSSPPADQPVFRVEVIETTPLPGLDLRLEQVPAPVQTASGADIEASGALDL